MDVDTAGLGFAKEPGAVSFGPDEEIYYENYSAVIHPGIGPGPPGGAADTPVRGEP